MDAAASSASSGGNRGSRGARNRRRRRLRRQQNGGEVAVVVFVHGWSRFGARSSAGTHRSQTRALELHDEHWSEEDDDHGGEVLGFPWRIRLEEAIEGGGKEGFCLRAHPETIWSGGLLGEALVWPEFEADPRRPATKTTKLASSWGALAPISS